MKDPNWLPCTKKRPCPICQKDWCAIHRNGEVVYCMRVESALPKGDGWIHRLTDPVPVPKVRLRPKPAQPVKSFTDLACTLSEKLLNIVGVADDLGVSVRSLERLLTGWNGNVCFPMRSQDEQVIGIRVRGKGQQWCVPGSLNGLFWPQGLDYTQLYLPEGPTDCAALLTAGFNAIGRPSCSGGVRMITALVQKTKCRTVIVVADNDEEKFRPDGSGYFPGQDGAEKLAQALKDIVPTVKILTPPRHKDVREWLNDGGSGDIIRSVVDSTEPVE